MNAHILELIALKIQQRISEEEQDELEQLLLSHPEYIEVVERLQSSPEYLDELLIVGNISVDQVWKQLKQRSDRRSRLLKRWLTWGSVAAMIVTVLSVWSIWQQQTDPEKVAVHEQAYGMKKAILEFSDGRQLTVDQQVSLNIREEGSEIEIEDSTFLVYKPLEADHHGIEKYNTLYVPRGCEFALTLSDGTKVWMNSDSRLKFPVVFTGKERNVYLQGEACFEVAKNLQSHFFVRTGKMNIEVTGTTFNVMAYESETLAKTTLLEGHVTVRIMDSREAQQNYELQPGEQCTLDCTQHQVTVGQVNTAAYVAWKEGLFFFDDETVEALMKKIERWYNMDVVYEDEGVKSEIFYGTVTRYGDVSQVLDMLVLTKTINYEVKDRTIYIRK